jgi:hypothetical protein
MSHRMVASNPNMDDMPHGSAHYKCVLRYQRRQMTVYFSHGPAICADPQARDVLDCLLSDMYSVEGACGFMDWARDMGVDLNDEDAERKARKTYNAIDRQSDKLRNLLGWETLRDLRQADDTEKAIKRLCA